MKSKWLWFSIIVIPIALFLAFIFCLPKPLFDDPTSTEIESREGKLLGARIADDGQWRFPASDSVPCKFEQSIINFEDRYFYDHPGVNIFALGRAFIQNVRAGEIVSGGSTLSMQVIRLSRKGKQRTFREKIIEMFLALRLEMRYSKQEILTLYASHAPFGGNVVGLEAAAWRYFGRPPAELSWAEAAAMAVLPNAPALIYPGKNQEKLLRKRNHLLKTLQERDIIGATDYSLAISESLPGRPLPLEQAAMHLLNHISSNHKGEKVQTTLDYYFQKKISSLVDNHVNALKYNQIHNAAVLVVEVETGTVKAWVGNTSSGMNDGQNVDMVTAPRSTGSILKPILYAAMLNDGLILPGTLIPDVPTQIGGFNPVNFDKKYSGAIPANRALSRSLNVPAVKMLQQYGVPRFKQLLENIGMSTLKQSSDHYGLSLILGGAETTMYDLAGIYSSFGRVLNHFHENSGRYDPSDFRGIQFLNVCEEQSEINQLLNKNTLSASSIWFAIEAMLKVNLPESLTGRGSFSSSGKIAWKTGTSFGFRDAWAVGINPEYVVVVWVGNADGEGRPGLTGVGAAAPLMFDVFNLLPETEWFDKPWDEMVKTEICRKSGYRAGRNCESIDTLFIQYNGLKTEVCPYHQKIHLDETGKYRVNSECYDPLRMKHVNWFVLPPVMEWYFAHVNPLYQPLPTYLEQCYSLGENPMEFVYPSENSKLFIPKGIQGKSESLVFEVAHKHKEKIVYWYLDEDFLGSTSEFHQMELTPVPGIHTVNLFDDAGNSLSKTIEIISGTEDYNADLSQTSN